MFYPVNLVNSVAHIITGMLYTSSFVYIDAQNEQEEDIARN